MATEQHNKLLGENVTKTCKKAPPKIQKSINLEAKYIATKNKLSNRIENLPETPTYVTLKDHKNNFRPNPSCRLINAYNQWKNTNEVIHWFSSINEKQNYKFIQLDMKEFYPSISEETLNKAINFAENHTSISQENIRIIKHCRKSLLFYNNEPWKKKEHGRSFDVTMGSSDDAELFELIGIYIQSLLESTLEKDQMGLY